VNGEDLELPVPTCPDWSVKDLIVHLGDVYCFWQAQLEAATPDVRCEPGSWGVPAQTDVMEWFESASACLVASLSERDPEQPCWNWSSADLTAAWVARRMALESAVHRYDAEVSIGHGSPIERALAIDGIEERIGIHLAIDVREAPRASLGGVLCLACSDDAAAWTVEVGNGRLRWREGRAPADAVLVGPASDLCLYCWNRKPLEALEHTGSYEVAAAWSSLPI
jgi:uncharacterized protein (TIGR03083 family)